MNDDFYKEFQMQVRPSLRKLRRLKKFDLRYNPYHMVIDNSMLWSDTTSVEEVDCVEVFMPEDMLVEIESRLKLLEEEYAKYQTSEKVIKQLREEQLLRINNPTVRKAYDKYQMLLEMVRK